MSRSDGGNGGRECVLTSKGLMLAGWDRKGARGGCYAITHIPPCDVVCSSSTGSWSAASLSSDAPKKREIAVKESIIDCDEKRTRDQRREEGSADRNER